MPRVWVHANENGPNVVFVDKKFVLELCRCGHSKDKPFCDGSHKEVGFRAPAADVTLFDSDAPPPSEATG